MLDLNPQRRYILAGVITWDERKRQTNLRRHQLDFVGCEAVFDHPVVTLEDTRDD